MVTPDPSLRAYRHNPYSPPSDNPPSKWETYGFAIAIIMGIVGLVVGAAGLTTYYHAGALSHGTQVDAIIMMAAGGGSGLILLIIGVVGSIKIREGVAYGPEVRKSIDTKGGLVYGPEAWRIWNAEVLDSVPLPPTVDLSNRDKILLYIPRKIKFHGEVRFLTLDSLREITGESSRRKDWPEIRDACRGVSISGWVLIDKNIIPGTLNQSYVEQRNTLRARGCRMPHILEALTLSLMLDAFNEQFYRRGGDIRCKSLQRNFPHVGVVGNYGVETNGRAQEDVGAAGVYPTTLRHYDRVTERVPPDTFS